jgi:quercetin dioxygenase-like cupin family protein
MPEPHEPDLNHVRAAMREHDATQEEPRMSHGPTAMEEGVTVTTLDREGDERFQSLRRDLGVTTFGMNLIRLRPRQQGRIHRHERQEEVYLVLEGTLTLEVEGESRELATGSLARIAPTIRRRLSNRGDELLLVLALGGAEPHAGRDGTAFASWEDTEGAPPQDIPLPPDLP